MSDQTQHEQIVAAFESTKPKRPAPSSGSSSNVLFTKEKGKYRLADGNLYDADQ